MYLCQVAPYVTFPPRMGGDHRTHGLVKEFSELDDRVVRYCQGGSPAMYRTLDLRRRVQIDKNYEERRHLHPLHEALKAPMLFGYPNLFASGSLRLASDGLDAMMEDADVILVREPWQMPYVLTSTDENTPIVFSSHNVETERFGDINQPLFSGRVRDRVATLEQRAVEETDAIVCTSERDADVYREQYDPGGPIIVAPNGAYEDDLRPHRPGSDEAVRIRQEYDIPVGAIVCLFMGSNYRPNVEAAEVIVDIAHELSEAERDVWFLIMGDVGSALDSNSLPDNVIVTGYVEEWFEAHFDAADIALNPMLSGGGTNIKLIEYFARSLPVVSTPFGTRGIEADDERHLLSSEIDMFDQAILRLRSDDELRERLGANARELVSDNYTWEASSRRLRTRIHDLFGPF